MTVGTTSYHCEICLPHFLGKPVNLSLCVAEDDSLCTAKREDIDELLGLACVSVGTPIV